MFNEKICALIIAVFTVLVSGCVLLTDDTDGQERGEHYFAIGMTLMGAFAEVVILLCSL